MTLDFGLCYSNLIPLSYPIVFYPQRYVSKDVLVASFRYLAPKRGKMKFLKCLPLYAGFILAVFVLVGCGSSEPAETVTPESLADPVIQPTETAVPPTETAVPPTETAVPPTETAVPPTPEPTATPEPPTPTPEPTPEPTVIHDPTPAWAAGLIGTWVKPGEEIAGGTFPDAYIRYYDDGTFRVSESRAELNSGYRVRGSYWFEGDVYAWRDLGGRADRDPFCTTDQIGRYEIAVTPGDSLFITLLEEPCGNRATNFTGMWTWVSP